MQRCSSLVKATWQQVNATFNCYQQQSDRRVFQRRNGSIIIHKGVCVYVCTCYTVNYDSELKRLDMDSELMMRWWWWWWGLFMLFMVFGARERITSTRVLRKIEVQGCMCVCVCVVLQCLHRKQTQLGDWYWMWKLNHVLNCTSEQMSLVSSHTHGGELEENNGITPTAPLILGWENQLLAPPQTQIYFASTCFAPAFTQRPTDTLKCSMAQ